MRWYLWWKQEDSKRKNRRKKGRKRRGREEGRRERDREKCHADYNRHSQALVRRQKPMVS